MGYIIIDENKLDANLRLWNDPHYRNKAKTDVMNARVEYSHMLEALQEAEKEIDSSIQQLTEKKNNIKLLMQYAK